MWLNLFSWKSDVDKESSCIGFYWFALVTLVIPTAFFPVVGMAMAKKNFC
jgi:hypothetical protein